MKAYSLCTYLLTLCLITTLQNTQCLHRSLTRIRHNQPRSHTMPYLSTCFHSHQQPPYKAKPSLEQHIEYLLPQYFDNNQQILNTLQQGGHQPVLVIGQTGAGKSTLISGLIDEPLALQQQQTIHTLYNADQIPYETSILVNTQPHGPITNHTITGTKTLLPQAYPDQATNLAFIDTAGFGDTTTRGHAISICNAISTRSLIEQIGYLQCIITVIDYNNLIHKSSQQALHQLLLITNNLLKDTSSHPPTSSIVLAFTKVPDKTTKDHIITELRNQCYNLTIKGARDEMTAQDTIIASMYKALFPNFYGINKQNVPLVLLTQNNLLQQGLVRQNILPTIQNTQTINKQNIGLMLTPFLLEKTQIWLTKKAHTIANDITDKATIDNNIACLNQQLQQHPTQARQQHDVHTLYNQRNQCHQRLKQHQQMPYIITQVASFMEVDDNGKRGIDLCKQYYTNSLQKHNQGTNNIDNTLTSSTLASSIALGTATLAGTLSKQ